jgi:hypothetical protein
MNRTYTREDLLNIHVKDKGEILFYELKHARIVFSV